jgi:hypothetical protein
LRLVVVCISVLVTLDAAAVTTKVLVTVLLVVDVVAWPVTVTLVVVVDFKVEVSVLAA